MLGQEYVEQYEKANDTSHNDGNDHPDKAITGDVRVISGASSDTRICMYAASA